MMKIKELNKQDAGLQYAIESMEFMSSAGRRVALESAFITRAEELESEWDRMETMVACMQEGANKRSLDDLRHCLMQLHDLQGTLTALSAHTPLNEVELFEIKNLSMLCGKARAATAALGIDGVVPLPDLGEVTALLDPDRTGIANFYIYDSYHPRLAPLRRELKSKQEHGGDPTDIANLLAEQNEIQQQVCIALSDALYAHLPALGEGLEGMAYADWLMAKADLSLRWSLTRPTIGRKTAYEALTYPRLKHRNEELGLRYQAIDVAAGSGVTLITGANMAGKTVLLKSIATAQLMVQCGLYAPAQRAEVRLVEGVERSIGDDQDEMNGLSSYAAEIVKISGIVETCRSRDLLVLIDEPARTTNPTEGKALVKAIIRILNGMGSTTIITTHYGQLGTECRRLRVKGFVEEMCDKPLTPRNINSFIDYSLTEDTTDDVPHEALRIAEILGCAPDIVELARQNFNSGNT